MAVPMRLLLRLLRLRPVAMRAHKVHLRLGIRHRRRKMGLRRYWREWKLCDPARRVLRCPPSRRMRVGSSRPY